MDRIRSNPWLTALVSWVGATFLVVLIYTIWQASRGEVVHWDLIRNAALIGAPIALINALRDRRRKEE